jgi:circadian clock protein KaiC
MLALKQFFAGRKCTVLLLDDMSSEAAGLHVKTIVHGVLSLTQSAPAYGADRRQLRILKLRGAPYRGGYHDFCVETGGLRVYPRLVAREHHRDYASGLISSGIPTLDDLLGGGLDRGSSTLVMGPAGAGKTSLAMHYAVKACEEGSRIALMRIADSCYDAVARWGSGSSSTSPLGSYTFSRSIQRNCRQGR